MSFMDQIKSKAESLVGQQLGEQTESGHALEAFSQLANQSGGIQGLISQFESKGLGHIVQSWIGPGQNLPVSAEQLKSVIGSEKIDAIAQKVGIKPEELQQKLATYMPKIVDLLTPNGQVSSSQFSLSNIVGMGKQLMSH